MEPRRPRHYWRDLREREAGPGHDAGGEFPEPLDAPAMQLGRRDFLAAAGLTAAATALAGCNRAPPRHAIPHLAQPPEMVPGASVHYASTCGGCSAGCGVLVKVRDGRPIKLEGQPSHPVSRGGLCAIGQASLLELYDVERLNGPRSGGRGTSWEEVDRAILAKLSRIRAEGGAVRFLSDTVTSPTLHAQLEAFLARLPDGRRVTYDPLSSSALLDAHAATHGARVLPRYRLDRAEVIVAFDADFLGTWISPVEHTAGYRAGRAPDAQPPRFSLHVQLESRLSLTGSKADRRIRLGPGEHGLALTHLVARLAERAGAPFPNAALEPSPVAEAELDELVRRLWAARGRSLVLCGSQDVATQALANLANQLLESYGATIELDRPSRQRAGDDRALAALRRELEAGQVAALFVHGVNPVFDLPDGARLGEALRRIPLVVSLSGRWDETARLAHHVCPDHHFLESWGDAEAVSGAVSVFQPVIHPLGATRSALESLAVWSGRPAPAYELLRESWRTAVFPRQQREASFARFWNRSVHDGFAEVAPEPLAVGPFRAAAVRPVPKAARPATGALALVLYPKVGVLDGRHAANAWLQELPDPVSKVTWDNYACLSPAAAAGLGVKDGDVIRLEAGPERAALELPAWIQPGQHDGTVAVALGYGGVLTERFAGAGKRWRWGRASGGPDGRVGKNAAELLALDDGTLRYARLDVTLARTGRTSPLACTQSHHTVRNPGDVPLVAGQRRDLVRETTLRELGEARERPEAHARKEPESLWPDDHPYQGHRWHMVIDLAACTGCSACVVSCQAENNIPVVGKDEVLRHREMHWLRIDRYYSGDDDEVEVVHQPLLCAQCDNAPCETVCPVLATVHSAEGLNQQVYNRCVGTRYCANNCPYKVRRFNWFDYSNADRRHDLALNPDVTVRSRGVMEKCTFCVQRIQAARIEARVNDRSLGDGEVRTACQQSCPASAIEFGDLNDPSSRVARLAASRRGYRLLEELNVRPAVQYLELVRNRDDRGEEDHHG